MSAVFKNILKFFYLLQLENYNVFRYFQALEHKNEFLTKDFRQHLIYTNKIKVLILIYILINLLILALFILVPIFLELPIFFILLIPTIAFLTLVLMNIVMPAHIVLLTTVIFFPADYLLKERIYIKAKQKLQILQQSKEIKIIGVAGSYGKTTMKQMLKEVLATKYNVIYTKDNINTPIGISRQILNELNESYDIYIVEMGEYYKGDISKICSITKPNIGIITGINEAHLDRLKKIDTTIATIYEIAEFAEITYINADSRYTKKGHKKYFLQTVASLEDKQKQEIKITKTNTKQKKAYFYSGKNTKSTTQVSILEMRFDEVKLINKVKAGYKNKEFNLDIKILGDYILTNLDAIIDIALDKLDLTIPELQTGISKIEPVEHRLQPIIGDGDVLVIDDSYNGTMEGVNSAINLLGKFKKRRKIYLTPGLVEQGDNTEEIHRKIGNNLIEVADVVILVLTSSSKYIKEELENLENIWSGELHCFKSSSEAFASLPKILKPKDVIMFQNDWSDNYL